jgi:6-phosphogluconate dehydrogenase
VLGLVPRARGVYAAGTLGGVMSQMKIGLVGLGVMGENLALNIEEKGFPIAVYNRSTEKVDEFINTHAGKRVKGCRAPKELIEGLEKPRRIIMMVKAGKPVDDTIAAFEPYLDEGDILIDGGNEFFTETARRAEALAQKKVQYVGMGVSGGEEGARHGPSLMPGGPRPAYETLSPILTKIAAQVDDGPCVDYMGPGGAGHYVKMVHNGIEYGDMQLIAECYDVMRTLGGMSVKELAETFAEWNQGELQSFLIEITAKVLRKKDDQTGKPLVDVILDATGMKGTGKWTVQQAAELASPLPTIASSLEARMLSAQKQERVAASKILGGPKPEPVANIDKKQLVEDVRHALYASKVCSYAQGMRLLSTAGKTYEWDLQLGRIARIWKGGCIIRAKFLGRIKEAYERDANLTNLLVDAEFAKELAERQAGWRRVLGMAIQSGLPMPTMTASLAYYDGYRRERLPANLTQAQRDFFGAHTYQRIDKEGSFHTDWSSK